jgi:hypothetical protein
MDSGKPARFWARWNRLLYTLYWRLSNAWPRFRSKRFWKWAGVHLPRPATYDRPLLYLTWGRIGDTAIGTAVSRHLKRLFDRPVVMVGREEVEDLVVDHVDHFLPFSPEAWTKDERYRRQFLDAVWDDYDLAIADIHFFNGGATYFTELLDLLPIKRKFVYEGYADPQSVAPSRTWPKSAVVISSLKKSPDDEPDGLHVLRDHVHFLGGILQVCGVGEHLHAKEAVPALETATNPELLGELGLQPGHYVACQPFSNNAKKDYPAAHWRHVFEAFPEQLFVLLGNERDARKAAALQLENVQILCGETSLAETVQVIREAQSFLGVDSSLTHIATCLGRPTVAVAHCSNLGYFLPYPEDLGFDNLRVVHNAEYEDCARCFTSCTQEPIWNTYYKGALCLRTLPVEDVIAKVTEAVMMGEPVPTA